MVRLVGEIHDAFVAGLSTEDAEGEDAAVVENGSVVEWHAKFDLASVPGPGVAAERARQRETRSEKKVRRRSYELRRDELFAHRRRRERGGVRRGRRERDRDGCRFIVR